MHHLIALAKRFSLACECTLSLRRNFNLKVRIKELKYLFVKEVANLNMTA